MLCVIKCGFDVDLEDKSVICCCTLNMNYKRHLSQSFEIGKHFPQNALLHWSHSKPSCHNASASAPGCQDATCVKLKMVACLHKVDKWVNCNLSKWCMPIRHRFKNGQRWNETSDMRISLEIIIPPILNLYGLKSILKSKYSYFWYFDYLR